MAPWWALLCVYMRECVHVCEHVCEYFKPWSCASYGTLTGRKGSLQFALSESQWLLNNYELVFSTHNYCLSSPIRSEHALSANCLSLLPCSLLERAAGGGVKWIVRVCVDAYNLCMCLFDGVQCLYIAYVWPWCAVVLQQWSGSCPAGAFRLIDTDNNTHNSQRFCP